MGAKQLEQNGDPLPRRHDAGDEHLEAAHWTTGDDNVGSRLRIGDNFYRLPIGNHGAQLLDEVVIDHRGAIAETDDVCNARKSLDLTPLRKVIETREEVTREERFVCPDRLARAHPTEADAGREEFDACFALEETGDLALLVRGSVDAEPVQRESRKEKAKKRSSFSRFPRLVKLATSSEYSRRSTAAEGELKPFDSQTTSLLLLTHFCLFPLVGAAPANGK